MLDYVYKITRMETQSDVPGRVARALENDWGIFKHKETRMAYRKRSS